MDHIEYARFSICMIAQSFIRVQGYVVPRVSLRYPPRVPRIESFGDENKRDLTIVAFKVQVIHGTGDPLRS